MAAPGPDPANAELEERTASTLRTAGLLAELGGLDRLYADLYLERARSVLSAVCSRERFLGLVAERQQLDRVASELGRAVDRGTGVASRASRATPGSSAGACRVPRARGMSPPPVYRVRPLVARPLALSLAGTRPSRPGEELQRRLGAETCATAAQTTCAASQATTSRTAPCCASRSCVANGWPSERARPDPPTLRHVARNAPSLASQPAT